MSLHHRYQKLQNKGFHCLPICDNMIYKISSDGWKIIRVRRELCIQKYGGVTPAYPPVKTNNFPVVSSLQPTFRWEPSTKDGVLYDLVLYRAVSYSPLGIGGHYLPGQVVEYRQGLVEPSYRLSKPLEPNEKYFWSVRLRRDGIVSNWSRFSYLNFMIFAYTSEHSSWFGFATPGNVE